MTPNQKRRGFHEFGTNKVIGVMDDKAKVDAARAALTSIGITDAMIEVFCSLEGERNLDLKGESHGFLDHIGRIFEHVRLVGWIAHGSLRKGITGQDTASFKFIQVIPRRENRRKTVAGERRVFHQRLYVIART